MEEISNQRSWSNLVNSLEERFASGNGTTHGTTLASHPAITASIDNITCLPTEDDYPLWRVRCKVTFFIFKHVSFLRCIQAGLEEEIVFFLLQMVHPQHETRSAFVSGWARGWVYVEATMNDLLRRLLRLTPGVLCNRNGICVQHIPLDEGLELLKFSSKDPPGLGKLVQVRRGTYKGDIGFVSSVATSNVRLLLIPRPAPGDSSRSKRTRSRIRPTLKLFNHETDKQYYAVEPCRISENIYSVGSHRFEHGLTVRSYTFDSVSTGVSTIPLESFKLFRESFHPELMSSMSAFPRPTEWYFDEGEEVYNLNDEIPTEWWWEKLYKSGFISKLRDDAAELDTEEGIVIVPWMAICKVLRIGDFVEVTGGLHKEQKGWVDKVNLHTQVANVIRMVDNGKPISDHVEVRLKLNECPPHVFIPIRRSK